MIKTLVIYSSKYGSTREVARIISLITGPAIYCTVDEFKQEYIDFDFIVIGTPIYKEKIDKSIKNFAEKNREWLKNKPIALFCTCLDKNGGLDRLTELQNFIGVKAQSLKAVGGKLIIDDLDQEDLEQIKIFLDKVNLPIEDMDFYNQDEIVKYSLKLKSIKEKIIDPLNSEELKIAVEDFLTSHNTCTLTTGHNNTVRSTPIEYNYKNGSIYILSEGGEKFANLLYNKNVSVAVYEDYTSMNNLKGMQITGEASIITNESEEYTDVLTWKGLDGEAVKSLTVNLNMIKIKLIKVEFLNSEFKDLGVDIKQIYKFE
jgi:menaquinone-dependent protoporphyrinogen IX oxidase/uncharacterized protein YhbP (UPF0306 family)